MERRSFLKVGGLLGLTAVPAATALAERPVAAPAVPPPADPTPLEMLREWFVKPLSEYRVGDVTTALNRAALETSERLVPAEDQLSEEATRAALLADPALRARRHVTPNFVADLWDNSPREMPDVRAFDAAAIPLGTIPMNVYVGGHDLPDRLLRATHVAVGNLIAHVWKYGCPGGMTRPRLCLKQDGYTLEFFFYTHQVFRIEPASSVTYVPVQHTTIYPRTP